MFYARSARRSPIRRTIVRSRHVATVTRLRKTVASTTLKVAFHFQPQPGLCYCQQESH
jgi:hypothetical protein